MTVGDNSTLSIGDVALVIGAPILALLIAARRAYLLYLSTLSGGWTELYWAVPVLAIVSAAVVTVWAWREGGPHRVAFPALMACMALTAAGAIAWEVTMR